jgi:type IV pilus biogenesis protein CpaD/CtpE
MITITKPVITITKKESAMTRNNDAATDRPRHALARALIVAGMMATVAACADDGPSTGSAIQSDIDSNRWVNQLPTDIPDAQPLPPGLEMQP